MCTGCGEVSVVGNTGPMVVPNEMLGFVVMAGSVNVDVPKVSAGLEEAEDVVFSVYGRTADQEVVSEWDTKGVVASVVLGGEAEVVVGAVFVNFDVLVSGVVTLVVNVLQSAVEELGAWVVVVEVEYKADAGSCDAVDEEVVSLDEVTERDLCVVASAEVSSLRSGVISLVTSGGTVAEAGVLVALTVDGDTCPISASGKVLVGKGMLVTALDNPDGMTVVVVGASTSTIPVFLVGTAVVVVEIRVVVLPISKDVSEISECVVVVPDSVTECKEDVSFVVCSLA